MLDAFNRRLGRAGAGAAARPSPAGVGETPGLPAATAGAAAPQGAPPMVPARGAGATQELMARFRWAMQYCLWAATSLSWVYVMSWRPAQVWRQYGRAVQCGGRRREGEGDHGGLLGAAQEPR